MSEEKQTTEPIRVGLVGAGGFARQTVDQLDECPDVRVTAVGDLDRELAEQTAARFEARAYCDLRSLMVESPIDAVIMSLPNHVYPEYVSLAAGRGLHLLKENPLGRSFEEGSKFVTAFEQAGKVFMIATQRRFQPGFAALKSRLAEVGKPFLARSHCLFGWSGDFRWRGERAKAGFGVLGDAGYHNIDLLTWLFGPPAEVYSLQSGRNRRDSLHPYDTDDTAVAVLRYPTGLMAEVTCCWVTAGQAHEPDLVVHGTEGVMSARPGGWEKIDPAGTVVERQEVESPADLLHATVRGKIGAFVSAIRAGRRAYPCSGRENLLNQAVIEAAYLSGRTGQPQSPAWVFQLHGLTMEDYQVANV